MQKGTAANSGSRGGATKLELAKEAAQRGADFVFTGDDYASTERPFISPKMFREFLAPQLKRVMTGFKELGLPERYVAAADEKLAWDQLPDSEPFTHVKPLR